MATDMEDPVIRDEDGHKLCFEKVLDEVIWEAKKEKSLNEKERLQLIEDKRGTREAKAKARAAKIQATKKAKKMASLAKESKKRMRAQATMNATAMADADVQDILSGMPDADKIAARRARIERDIARTAKKRGQKRSRTAAAAAAKSPKKKKKKETRKQRLRRKRDNAPGDVPTADARRSRRPKPHDHTGVKEQNEKGGEVAAALTTAKGTKRAARKRFEDRGDEYFGKECEAAFSFFEQ